MRNRQQFNALMLAVSAALGTAAWFLCAAVYDVLADSAPGPLLMGLMFGILALMVTAGVLIVSLASGTFERNMVTGGSIGSLIGFLAIAVLLTAALAGLFQWIYSLRFRSTPAEPTSYIFLIDDSGSMADNDPGQLRYAAISQVLQDKNADFPYMIYGFADGVEVLREMQPMSAGEEQLTGVSSGGTAIKAVLEQVLADCRSGRWDGGEAPKVVLLTDGCPTDFSSFSAISKILKEYAENQISVSTVGLGGADVSLMERIAGRTGGVFVDIQDAGQLAEALASAAARYSAGNLVTTRYDVSRLGVLFGFLRVLFLTALGTGIGLTAAAAYGRADSMSLILLSSAIMSLAGALLLELCTSLLELPDRPFWFILWVLIAAMLCIRVTALRPNTKDRPRGPRPSRSRRGRSNRLVRTL